MDINDVAASLQQTNPEMAAVVSAFSNNFQENLGRIQTLEKDVKISAEKLIGI